MMTNNKLMSNEFLYNNSYTIKGFCTAVLKKRVCNDGTLNINCLRHFSFRYIICKMYLTYCQNCDNSIIIHFSFSQKYIAISKL